ncbi:MAG: transglutaminase-like cysteine peptidase [Pseudomonadota bacterium]
MIKKNILKFFSLKFLHFSVFTSIYLLQPAHAGHLQKLLPQSQLKKIQRDYDHDTAKRFSAWDNLLQSSQTKTPIEKLQLVNDFFNQMKWVNDRELWNSKDYWATPIESLIRNAGDCEDFSIAKYFTLLELGIAVNKLKISYVKIIDTHDAHIVLAYYPDAKGDPLIMDNINKTILPSSQRTDLKPMFNFNGEGIWSQEQPHTRMDSVTKIRHWADMVKRMNSEEG